MPRKYNKTWTVGLWMTVGIDKSSNANELWVWNIVRNKHNGDYLWSVFVKATDEKEALAKAERIFLTQYNAEKLEENQKESMAA